MAAKKPHSRPSKNRLRFSLTLLAVVLALLASTVGIADAQVDAREARPVRDVESLRLACHPDFINGERGVLCRWSKAENENTRAYQLYRITNGEPRQLVTTVGADGRLGFFDSSVSAPSTLVYGVIAVNRSGRLIGRSEPVRVEFGQDIEQLRMACGPKSIEGERGILCRWSEPNQRVRGYQLYRLVGDGEREIIATIAAGGRQAYFDRNVIPGAAHTYGVVAVDRENNVVATGGPRTVRWPAG